MTNNFNETLLLAIKICDRQVIRNQAFEKGFSTIYPFTTENIAGYIKNFDLKDKTLLTVGSSLDQALNAILYDCKDITILDINPHIKYYYYLKVATILELNMKEFLEYLRYKSYPDVFKDNRNVFNKESYNKLKNTLRLLDYESYLYWDKLCQIYEPQTIRNYLFSLDEDRNSTIIGCNPYLHSEDSYNLLRTNLKRTIPKFLIDDIFDVKLTKKYDNIWLSNICYYLSEKEIKKLVDNISKSLSDKGKMLISYLYDTKQDTKYEENWAPIYNLGRVNELLKEYQYFQDEFQGVVGLRLGDEKIHDSALIYHKTI